MFPLIDTIILQLDLLFTIFLMKFLLFLLEWRGYLRIIGWNRMFEKAFFPSVASSAFKKILTNRFFFKDYFFDFIIVDLIARSSITIVVIIKLAMYFPLAMRKRAVLIKAVIFLSISAYFYLKIFQIFCFALLHDIISYLKL